MVKVMLYGWYRLYSAINDLTNTVKVTRKDDFRIMSVTVTRYNLLIIY